MMIKVKRPFGYYDTALGIIGRTGENNTRTIDFDCAAELKEYQDANIICVCLRPGDDEPYTIPLSTDGDHRVLTLSSADLEKEGRLTLELRMVDGDKVLKSARFTGTVASSLQGEGDAPGMPVRDTLDRLDAEIKAAQAVVDDIRAKLDAGEFDGPQGPKGDPGSDASVTAESIQSALGYAPVKDVQMAGTSVLENGVANVPIAQGDAPGVVSVLTPQDSGILNDNGSLRVSYATDAEISSRTGTRKAIVCANMDYAVKAAMCDGKGAAWTDAEQKAARERMGAAEAFEVGDGLQMTGDVLGVKPEGVYELIETITLEEEVAIISADTTGYVKVKLWLEVPSDGNDNPGVFVVNSDATAYCGKMKDKDRTHQFSIEYVNRNGMVFLGSYGGGGTGESTLMYPGDVIPYPRALKGNTVDAINSIDVRMLYDGFYPVGTKIKIWGVRADA